MSVHRPIGVGIVGLGFMGRTHIRAFREADRAGAHCRIVAAHALDGTLNAVSGNLATSAAAHADIDDRLDPAVTRLHTSLDSFAADPAIQLAVVATPTDTHVEIASRLLAAGKHVLVEKPVAIRSADILRLRDAARAAGRHCIPAMCMRYWPGWDWLISQMDKLALGSIVTASFTRIGSRPTWSPEFYLNPERSGGSHFDLHVHDVDILVRLFGPPIEVCAGGDAFGAATLYRFDNYNTPAFAIAQAAWVHTPGFPFRMRYCVQFEGATVDWDLARTDRLLVTRNGACEAVPIAQGAGYFPQAVAVIRALASGAARLPVTLDEALLVTRILEAEQRSMITMRPVCTMALGA